MLTVNEEGPILSFGDTNMCTRFSCGAVEFVNRWSEAGPGEATAIGCLGAQMITDEIFENLKAFRRCVRRSFEVEEYKAVRQLFPDSYRKQMFSGRSALMNICFFALLREVYEMRQILKNM